MVKIPLFKDVQISVYSDYSINSKLFELYKIAKFPNLKNSKLKIKSEIQKILIFRKFRNSKIFKICQILKFEISNILQIIPWILSI